MDKIFSLILLKNHLEMSLSSKLASSLFGSSGVSLCMSSQSHSLTLSHFLALAHSFLSLSLSLCLAHTHTHTHTHTLTYTLSYCEPQLHNTSNGSHPGTIGHVSVSVRQRT